MVGVVNFFGLDDDRVMARVCRDDIIEAACQVNTASAEAVFISCAGLSAVVAIAEIEKRIGKPVVTSVTAFFVRLKTGLLVSSLTPTISCLSSGNPENSPQKRGRNFLDNL